MKWNDWTPLTGVGGYGCEIDTKLSGRTPWSSISCFGDSREADISNASIGEADLPFEWVINPCSTCNLRPGSVVCAHFEGVL